jgi:hypothetical protein
MTIQIHYALFDQSFDTGRGNYWTWFDKELTLEILNRFHYEVAVKHLAPEPNKLTADDLWGGIVTLTGSGWTVLYRIYNGGYEGNRPGRYVVLTAWIKTHETIDINLLLILNNQTFQQIAAVFKTSPVPQPAALTENYVGIKIANTFSVPDNDLKKRIHRCQCGSASDGMVCQHSAGTVCFAQNYQDIYGRKSRVGMESETAGKFEPCCK